MTPQTKRRRRRIVTTTLSLLVLAGVAAWWSGRSGRSIPSRISPAGPPHPTPAPSAAASNQRPTFVATAENSRLAQAQQDVLIVPEMAAAARALNAPDSTVQGDLELLETLVAFYRRANGGDNPPGGLNEEIVDRLRGKNERRLAVIPPDHPSIDSRGQLLDRWGTPFWFHPISRDTLEIRSAGPDKALWTADDVGTADRPRHGAAD